MKKVILFSLVLSSGMAFASIQQNVEQSMGKVADAANHGVGKMVRGVEKVAKGAENMGKTAALDMKKAGDVAEQDIKKMSSKMSKKKEDMNTEKHMKTAHKAHKQEKKIIS